MPISMTSRSSPRSLGRCLILALFAVLLAGRLTLLCDAAEAAVSSPAGAQAIMADCSGSHPVQPNLPPKAGCVGACAVTLQEPCAAVLPTDIVDQAQPGRFVVLAGMRFAPPVPPPRLSSTKDDSTGI